MHSFTIGKLQAFASAADAKPDAERKLFSEGC